MLSNKLTETEEEVLSLINDGYLSQKKIAIRRGTSQQAVSKILLSLRNKGLISHGCNVVVKKRVTLQPKGHGYRVHGQGLRINIIDGAEGKYRDLILKANRLKIDGNNIELYPTSVVIHSGHSFFSDTVDGAMKKSVDYFDRILARLENDLKVVLVKSRSHNIKQFRVHVAEVNNELAKECNIKADKIKVFGNADGKLWFLIDNSFNLNEAETVHGAKAVPDMQDVVAPFFNDLRDAQSPLLSDMWNLIAESVKANRNTALGLQATTEGLKGVVDLIIKSQTTDEESEDPKKIRPDYVG